MSKKYKAKGWTGEPVRHGLAGQGIETVIDDNKRFNVNDFVSRGKDDIDDKKEFLGGDLEITGERYSNDSAEVRFEFMGENFVLIMDKDGNMIHETMYKFKPSLPTNYQVIEEHHTPSNETFYNDDGELSKNTIIYDIIVNGYISMSDKFNKSLGE